MEWEQIDPYHKRAMVLGGWLVKAYEDVAHVTSDDSLRSAIDFRIAMCFVPDPDHVWMV